MCSKVFGIIISLIALIMAVAVSVLPQERLMDLITVTRFFEAMIPVLAIGALVKYLFTRKGCGCGCKCACGAPK